ncbi:hypothetical protein ACMA1I_15405 [Pontibacter sp. 13R65]|uniref:hypothetical protein n=1 Tax=Pontibacter sp. 13R65 TaxID=3127458 RepID=UPI00301D636F
MVFHNQVLLGLIGALLFGGGLPKRQPEPIHTSHTMFFGIDPSTCEVIEFDEETPGQGLLSEIISEGTPVAITAQHRLPGGQYEQANVASLFDTSIPSARSTDFTTPNPQAMRSMGKVLTLGSSQPSQSGQSRTGGKLEVDFSAMSSITLKAVHVLDIRKEDAGSKLELINKKGEIFRTFELPITNTYGAIRLNTGDVKGVAKLRVVFGDEKQQRGGGAIDVIEFCRD